MKKRIFVFFLFCLLCLQPLNLTQVHASQVSHALVLSGENPAIKSNFIPKKKAEKRIERAHKHPQFSNYKPFVSPYKPWHLLTVIAFSFVAAFFLSLYFLAFSVPSILLWVILGISPFLAYLFAWLSYNKIAYQPQNFSGNQVNWFIIAVVTIFIYALMVLVSVFIPLMIIFSLFTYSPYVGNFFDDIAWIWGMWKNPPKIPPFPRKIKESRNESN